MTMAKKEAVSSYVTNITYDETEPVKIERPESRKLGELLDDRSIKWFDGIACKGAVIDQAYLQKDLERLVINGRFFSEYVRDEMEVGDSVCIAFDHVEHEIVYKVYACVVKERADNESQPIVLRFKKIKLEKTDMLL